MGRGGTQKKESGRILWPIHQNPEQCEQVGPALYFIDDDQKFASTPIVGQAFFANCLRIFRSAAPLPSEWDPKRKGSGIF